MDAMCFKALLQVKNRSLVLTGRSTAERSEGYRVLVRACQLGTRRLQGEDEFLR